MAPGHGRVPLGSKSHRPSAMQAAFSKLSQRVGKLLGLHFHEPSGQNGYDCLMLAGLDQSSDLGFELGLSATQLRTAELAGDPS